MMYDVVLGRDLLTCPSLCVTFGDTVKITKTETTCVGNEIMHIEYVDEPYSVRNELNINPEIPMQDSEEIREAYGTKYVENVKAEPCLSEYEMSIALKHEQPISMRPRRLAFAEKETLQKILDDLLERNVIRHSNSPYASPVVLAKKKDGSIRLCVDYCELNKITIRDNFPTELIDNNIDRLRDKKYFTVLDLRDGFYHLKMHGSSINFTSFVTPLEQFEYLRMPFGLINALQVFQRFVHHVFASLIRCI